MELVFFSIHSTLFSNNNEYLSTGVQTSSKMYLLLLYQGNMNGKSKMEQDIAISAQKQSSVNRVINNHSFLAHSSLK